MRDYFVYTTTTDPRASVMLAELTQEYDARYGDLFSPGGAAEEMQRYPPEPLRRRMATSCCCCAGAGDCRRRLQAAG
jgi:hypothetical protein